MIRAIGIQSMLFVPGSKPDRFSKALASGADLVCIDLEDSVAAGGKKDARIAALAAIPGSERLAIRINGLTTRDGLADLLALASADQKPRFIFIPKVEAAAEMHIAREVIDDADLGLIPLIETAKGLRLAHEIAAMPGVAAMMFGGGDLSADLSVDLAWDPLHFARSKFVAACAEASVPAIDVPFIELQNAAGLADETRKAKALGFTAKAAIHPDQIAVIHEIMRPTPAEMTEAEAAEAAYAQAAGGAVRFNGKMLEAPVMRRYAQILATGRTNNA